MPADDSPIAHRLADRALRKANTATVNHIHDWGQYHDSRLSQVILAHLAYPDDPDAVLNLRAHRRRFAKAAVNLEALCALAASLAIKARTDDERARTLDLFDLAHRRLGGLVPAKYRELHLMTAYLSGRRDRVRALTKSYAGMPGHLIGALHCQDAHPRNAGSAREFLKRLKHFADWPELLDDTPGPLSMDGLRTGPVAPVERGPLISVIMTCHEPDRTLLTAVRSVVSQTWQRWELLLVDDGSGAAYADVLKEAAALDRRVKLLIQPENGGAYQARNRGMAAAAGEFITGIDSDAWAHPRLLAEQVRPMLNDPRLVMVESLGLAAREDLSLVIDSETEVVAAGSAPIMFRTKDIRQRIGFHDEVREAADLEFRKRVKVGCGKRAWARMENSPLTLVRHTDTPLSGGEVSRHRMSAGRLAYQSGFVHWHRRISQKEATPFLGVLARPRPFPISRGITRSKAENRAIVYERLYAADWRELDRPRRSMLKDAAEQASNGRAVGLAHRPDWVGVDGKLPLIHISVLEAAAEHGLEFVDLEAEPTAPVIVPTEAYAELLRFEHPELAADRVRTHSSAADAPGAGAASAKRRPVRIEPRRLIRRRDAALAGCGLFSVGAAIASTAALDPGSLPWVATGSLAIWIAACSAQVTRQIARRVAAD